MSTSPTFPTSLDTYLSLITSEHRDKPKFMATVAARVQPYVDIQQTLYSMIGMFDTSAVGDQLDKVGAWVGVSRTIETPISGVFFSWGVSGVGWGQGAWLAPGQSETGLTVLDDDDYRFLIKLTIAKNRWDGTVNGAYTVFNSLFAAEGMELLIRDNQDMTMDVVILGILSLVSKALLNGGYFTLRPAGVAISSISEPSVVGAPVFGFGAQNSSVAGWGSGAWLQSIF